MKKLYILSCLLIGTTLSYAQDFILNPGNVVNENITTNSYFVSTINMDHDNSSSNQITLEWELIDLQVNADWDYSYCDYTNCYAGNITSGTMTPFGSGQSGFIKVNLYAPSIGAGYYVFKVYKTGDAANADTITYNFNVTLGLTDLELGKDVSIYPNPTENGNFAVENVLENSTVTLLNSLGQVIKTSKPKTSTLHFSNLEAKNGLYFVRLERDGEIYATRKVIIR